MGNITAPDGSFTITDEQASAALSVFHHCEQERPIRLPESMPESYVPYLRQGRLAGHLGVSLGLEEEETLALWKNSEYFRQYVAQLLNALDIAIRREQAAQS